MIKKLRLMLEYGCYPVWLYNEKDHIVDTLLPEDLRSDTALDSKFDDLQARYESLYINNSHEFTYVGFKSEDEKQSFVNDWQSAVAELTEKTNGKYEIVNDIDYIYNLGIAGEEDS